MRTRTPTRARARPRSIERLISDFKKDPLGPLRRRDAAELGYGAPLAGVPSTINAGAAPGAAPHMAAGAGAYGHAAYGAAYAHGAAQPQPYAAQAAMAGGMYGQHAGAYWGQQAPVAQGFGGVDAAQHAAELQRLKEAGAAAAARVAQQQQQQQQAATAAAARGGRASKWDTGPAAGMPPPPPPPPPSQALY